MSFVPYRAIHQTPRGKTCTFLTSIEDLMHQQTFVCLHSLLLPTAPAEPNCIFVVIHHLSAGAPQPEGQHHSPRCNPKKHSRCIKSQDEKPRSHRGTQTGYEKRITVLVAPGKMIMEGKGRCGGYSPRYRYLRVGCGQNHSPAFEETDASHSVRLVQV